MLSYRIIRYEYSLVSFDLTLTWSSRDVRVSFTEELPRVSPLCSNDNDNDKRARGRGSSGMKYSSKQNHAAMKRFHTDAGLSGDGRGVKEALVAQTPL